MGQVEQLKEEKVTSDTNIVVHYRLVSKLMVATLGMDGLGDSK